MQIKEAQAGTITPDMQRVADDEQISAEVLRDRIAAGHCIISRNIKHTNAIPLGVGKGLRTKVNANIGTSKDCVDLDDELKKLDIAIAAGADAVMDLSTGGDISAIRREIIKRSTVAIGTVPH
jgi:phosphomethylpyrimidine synthase